MQIGIESERIMAVIGGLFFFGLSYAALVNALHTRGYSEGYTAFLVVFGVLITLAMSTLLHHQDPLIDLVMELSCFAASGLPMIGNDWLRHVQARKAEQDYLAHANQEDNPDGTA